jgi:Domain of unknown function (DUF4129)
VANGEPRTTRRPATDAGQTGLARHGLPALGGLLLIAVFAGIAASTPAAATAGGPWYNHGLLVGVMLEIALAVLLAIVWTLDRRSPRRGYPVLALRRMLKTTIAVVMFALGALMIIDLLLHYKPHLSSSGCTAGSSRQSASCRRQQDQTSKQQRISHGRAHLPHLPWLPYLLLALLIAIVAVAIVMIVLRRRQSRWSAGYGGEFADEGEDLQRAVESGRLALRAVDDARAAIIACYRAMEESLAGAGAARDAAETPDELLTRAAAAGLVHGAAASRLTVLFYEARYSTHAMPRSALDVARQALDEISADLSIELAYAGGTDDGQ